MLSLLLTPAPSDARKRLPSESNHDLAASIREEVALSLHQHKGDLPCYFFTQITTFVLPAGMRKFLDPSPLFPTPHLALPSYCAPNC